MFKIFFFFMIAKNDILYYVTKFAVQIFNQVVPFHLIINATLELFISVIHTKNLKILWHIIFVEKKQNSFFKHAYNILQLFCTYILLSTRYLDSTYRYCRLITIFFLTTTALLLSPIVRYVTSFFSSCFTPFLFMLKNLNCQMFAKLFLHIKL